jgi:hypothetical protein
MEKQSEKKLEMLELFSGEPKSYSTLAWSFTAQRAKQSKDF